MRNFFVGSILAVWMLGAAAACPPPPPPPPPAPGESIEAWQARLEAEAQAQIAGYQRGWWEQSQSVLLARIERIDSVAIRNDWTGTNARSPRVRLRPVRWLKGSGPPGRFHLNVTGVSDCGPYGGGEAVNGRMGELFLVFVREGRPSQANVITSLALDTIVDEELKARVEAATSN
jgi:hypothetical protein